MKHKIPLILTLVLVLFAFTPAWCFAQEKVCLIDIKDSPSLRGIKLGMKKSEVEVNLGSQLMYESGFIILDPKSELNFLLTKDDQAAKKTYDSYEEIILADKFKDIYEKHLKVQSEERKTTFIPTKSQINTEKFKNVEMINLAFFDERLSSINIYYKTEAYKNLTDENFYSEILISLGMPSGIMSKSGTANCKNFSLEAGNFGDSIVIEMYDTTAKKAIRERTIQSVKDQYKRFKTGKGADFKP